MRDETDGRQAPATPQPKLKPANENPWYVLMTLYGEQEGEVFDEVLHEKNRGAWNAWAGQAIDSDHAEKLCHTAGVDLAELTAWEGSAAEIKSKFEDVYRRRSGDEVKVPDLPYAGSNIDASYIRFER